MQDMRSFFLRRCIASAGLKVPELAERMGVSVKTMRTRIAYPFSLSLAELKQLAEILGLTCTDLWAIVMGARLTIGDIKKLKL